MLRSFKAMLGTYKEKDIIRAYNVGCGLCALLVIGVTTYDIHRSIKVNDTPPSREQVESLAATIDNSRRANQFFYGDELGQNGKNSPGIKMVQKLATDSPELLDLVNQTMPADEDTGGVNIVGLVSDTHGVLEEATLLALRRATSIIIHAGDVGDKRYKKRLAAEQVIGNLAEGTGKEIVSVAGNVDEGCALLPAWQTIKIAGKKIVVIHICGFPPNNTAESEELIKSEAPDVVVFGHSHVPGVQKHDKTIFINPGSAGPRRFKLPRCISLLSIYKSGEVLVEFVGVSNLPQDVIALPATFRDPALAIQVEDTK